LLGLSQIQNLRQFYALNIPISNGEEDIKDITVIHIIMKVIKIRPEHKPNGLGIFMNICLEPTPSDTTPPIPGVSKSSPPLLENSTEINEEKKLNLKEIIVSADGLEIALGGVYLSSKERESFFSIEGMEGRQFMCICVYLYVCMYIFVFMCVIIYMCTCI
jgi:hypothetical protein